MISSDCENNPKRSLGLVDASAIVVGTVIGAGIYETTPLIAQATSGPIEIVAVFLLGGICALIGALCYAELGTTLNRSGGDYEYLHEAYGRRLAFLFAWMTFWVVQPAGVGAVAYIFARYAAELHPALGPQHFALLATSAVVALTAANIGGLRVGSGAQNLLTGLKVLGLLALVLVGLAGAAASGSAGDAPAAAADPELAFILVMYTYGGWNVLVLVAGEVREPQRNLLRALVLGLALVVFVYVLTVLAFEHALGHVALAASDSAAADVVVAALGRLGGMSLSVLICITCLANINATLLTNSRIFFAFGRSWPTFGWLGSWNHRRNAPINSLLAQGVIAVVLIVALAAGADSFRRLVVFSAPVFWLFFLLVAVALFVLRRRSPAAAGFRVPFYPVVPLLFTAICAYMLHASTSYAWSNLGLEAAAVACLLAVGGVVAFALGERG